ncbi:glycosyl hydrolases family 15-domain-containing protein [Chlamydoabsidia padenii]|nr:glycosyl hydrolases family 15-domain-containing protein [Chlamydoabsidia padenii]
MTIGRKKHVADRLDYYYKVINTTILSKQNAASGLIPASVAITSHGDYTDAWVRTFELEHAVVKLMRGLLFSMMRQASKVEKFKKSQHILDALHAKYKTETGATVVGDGDWGHLQIDATSLFLVALADMTSSGLNVVYTQDEVDFVQNLVFYIERAYRTPDFGIWERGDKTNNGQPELNSSSIGMAVAALKAINGVNLFGARGGPASVIYVLPDELTRNSTTLKSFLPRESNSKEIDGSVLSVIGFPAFAVDDPALIETTRREAKEKLEGRYGWKRFLRDGHQTSVEDTTRLHYNNSELKIFENIESEWPLFFTYLVLEGLFTGDRDQVEEYRNKLKNAVIDSSDWDPENPKAPVYNGDDDNNNTGPTLRTDCDNTLHIPLVPELYYVPSETIDAERANPHSQERIPNDNTPLVWALSLYILGNLIYEDLLSPSEMDPLGRRYNVQGQKRDTMTQIVLLAEDEELQNALATYGLETQTVDQISQRFTILPPRALADVYHSLGHNTKLGLTGRPKRPVGVLGTSRLYRMEGHIYAFTPYFMDNEAFYLNADPDLLVSTFESELAFARDNWSFPGRPTLTVVLTKDMIMGSLGKVLTFPTDASRKNLLNFFMNLRSGMCNNGVRVRLCRLAESLNTSNIASLDFLLEKAMDDWQNILTDHKSGGKKISGRRLGFNEYQTQASTPGAPGTPKRRSTSFHGKALGTPLDKLQDEGYFQDIAFVLESMNKNQEPVFRLKDHEGGTPKSSSDQPTSSNDSVATPPKIEINTSLDQTNEEPESYTDDNALSLTLGDSAQFNDAVESLKVSVNLYDQIDLLHYLTSCEGIDYYIGDLQATIKTLLEEVYLKAVHLQYWSIARQATGLLRKVVPSLTINITDLVIRQKQISIGSGQHEYLISRPVGPETVAEMIGKHCTDDVREGPVVQEIMIYLGGFIRTNPSMFDGILRLRTYYIIIALREEIRRINDCNEEEAIEHLMQLSPFELQSLLGTILSGPSLCHDADVLIRDRAAGLLMLNRALESRRSSIVDDHHLHSADVVKKDHKTAGTNHPSSIPISKQNQTNVVIRAQSGGYNAGNFAKVDINGNSMAANSRGLHVWAIDRHDKLILEHASFDTHISHTESDNFVEFINRLNDGVVLTIVARDDITEHLTAEATSILDTLGGKSIRNVKYRDSYLLITEKGNPDSAAEEHQPNGPTEVVERSFSAKYDKPEHEEINEKNIHQLFPTCNGRWLRRRMNDGALNRVPRDFFPQTWMVLDKCHGLTIGSHCLPRDPTVFDQTPGEFNFALAVESFLGLFTDPAQRQIAVEILSLTYDAVQDRLEDGQIMTGNVDIPAIMEDAQATFWSTWVEKNKAELAKSTLFKDGQFDYDTHKDLAKQLFYDLPLDGEESTHTYLTKSLAQLLPQLQ